jgi:hypothetical protein
MMDVISRRELFGVLDEFELRARRKYSSRLRRRPLASQ